MAPDVRDGRMIGTNACWLPNPHCHKTNRRFACSAGP